jgi:hypothetical protein
MGQACISEQRCEGMQYQQNSEPLQSEMWYGNGPWA